MPCTVHGHGANIRYYCRYVTVASTLRPTSRVAERGAPTSRYGASVGLVWVRACEAVMNHEANVTVPLNKESWRQEWYVK